jgi:hypothetical protein
MFGPQSVESEFKFRELTQVDTESLGSGIKLVNQKTYSEVLAPIYNVNDFSTEYLNRTTGAKLTGSKFGVVSTTKMIEMIL